MNSFIMKELPFNRMVQYCQSQIPIEACGLLSGKNSIITSTWCLPNAERSPYRYSIDHHIISHTFSIMNQKGEQLYGIFHSHPTSPAYPSQEDILNANYPEVTYVIVSLMLQKPETRCFLISNGKIIHQELTILP